LIFNPDPAINCVKQGYNSEIDRQNDNGLPIHLEIFLSQNSTGLVKDAKGKADQIRTLDKARLIKPIGHLDHDLMLQVDNTIEFRGHLTPFFLRVKSCILNVPAMVSFLVTGS